MKEQEILNLVSKSYRNLSRDYTEEGKQEWFIINKFKKLFVSKNYLEGKISDRIINELVNTFKNLHQKFYLEGLKCINIFDLLMCKDYASGKISEDEVINIIKRSVEERTTLTYRFYYDDSTRVYSTLVNRINDYNSKMDAFTFEKALKIKNKLEVYDYLPLLLSDNFQNGIISEEHLRLIGKIPNPCFSKKVSTVKRAIKVLISDNYKEGLIKDKHLRLFSTPELLSIKEIDTKKYVTICELISIVLTGNDFKIGRIKDEDIISLLNAFIKYKGCNIEKSVANFLNFIKTRNYKEGKVSIDYLSKFIELGYDSANLYQVLASDNFYDGLVTEEQINELYPKKELDNHTCFLIRYVLLWVLKSKAYRDNIIDYEELKNVINIEVENEELFLTIMFYILEEQSFDDETKEKYISVLLLPEVSDYIYNMLIDYKSKEVCDYSDFVKNICLFSLPVISNFVYSNKKVSSLVLKRTLKKGNDNNEVVE